MPQQASETVENTFVKGIVTEFSGLNFPENACEDALNVFFTEQGEARRRYGIDYEEDYVLNSYAVPSSAIIRSYFWRNVRGNPDLSFVVVQIADKLDFWQFKAGTLSPNYEAGYRINLSNRKAAGAPSPAKAACQFADGQGKLYVAHPYCEPFYVYFANSNMNIEEIAIEVRDFTVLDLDAEPDDHPASMTPEHEYDVRNQGWTNKYLDMWTNANRNPREYPSLADVWWYYRVSPGASENERNNADNGLEFSRSKRQRYANAGNAYAPRGYFIYSAWNIDRAKNAKRNLPGEIVSSGYNRPSCVAFMNNRIFYGGVDAYRYNSNIYFTNILRNQDEKPRFYQNGDPTSELNYELLPNDGGTIVVPALGKLIYMVQVDNEMILFANNGIWSLSGNEGVGFTATDYSVNQISDIGVLNSTSFVSAEGVPVWWNEEGIWTLNKRKVESLTRNTIQTLYNTIDPKCIQGARGAYNRITKEIMWLYSSNASTPLVYDKALVFRAQTGAFYVYQFAAGATIRDIIGIPGFTTDTTLEDVTDNSGVTVTTNAATTVQSEVQSASSQASTFKFLIKHNASDHITWGEIPSTLHKDWYQATGNTGVNFDSYFISGYSLKGAAHRKFNVPYITIFSKTTSDSSCTVQAVWDFINSGTARISNAQQVYKARTTSDFTWRRLKIRGSGKSLQLKFTSDTDKPFNIIGWSKEEMINAKP